ncbi:phosphoenolpyruvate--protein phosphotransferase [Desulfovibrio sp. OttesenSCG-928-M14]|nr:phosphoenolpyruvate--protein phosphotransferase [Desulfovibrio sp. OttesenSCG-928-M14]MDL2291062.1 phosphoenolpyruvate--protein phosphotransferase [Desulfovibrio sp. OttesenSCG-928-F20]
MARAHLHGIAVSTGIAIGKGFFLNRAPAAVRHELVPLEGVEEETRRLREAVAGVADDFAAARDQMNGNESGQIDLLNSHVLICRDPKLGAESERRIREQRMNAEWALEESVAAIAKTFEAIPSPYIRERMEDVRLVADRILKRLSGGIFPSITGDERGILLAHDMTPADAVGLVTGRIFSFAIEQGGQTSHTGILARSMRIPAVVGVSGLGEEIRSGDLIIVDGIRGQVLVEPDEAELREYAEWQARFEDYEKRIHKSASLPAETEDGLRVAVLANVESSAEAQTALGMGCEGVGLVRTEFGYITRTTLPDEETLYAEYRALARAMSPRGVVFRTLDVGGDKIFCGGKNLAEGNPALGMRAIRYCLRHQDMFRTQLRAVLRASAEGNVALMFPLISGVSELRAARSILNEAKQELDAEGVSFDASMPVGVMIELPSAVLVADMLAKEADFFSIGTNDLIQYSIGVDRGNKDVAYLAQPLHPAIVRSIKQVVDMAHKEGISVSVCGEMAADPYCLPILLGMPIDEVSVAPQSIPAVKNIIRRSSLQGCQMLLSHAMSAPTLNSINNMVRQSVYDHFPEDVEFFVSQMAVDG